MSNQTSQKDKTNLHFFVTFLAVTVLAFVIHGYVIYPIPPSQTKNASEYSTRQNYVIKEAFDDEYADGQILDRWVELYSCAFIVEQDGERHLLYFGEHLYTGRWRMIDDIVIAEDETRTHTFMVCGIPCQWAVVDGSFRQGYYMGGGSNKTWTLMFMLYALIGILVALVELTIYRKYILKVPLTKPVGHSGEAPK